MEKKAFIEQYEAKKETKKGLEEMNKYLKLAKTKSDEKIWIREQKEVKLKWLQEQFAELKKITEMMK